MQVASSIGQTQTDTLEGRAVSLLKEKRMKVTTAESCTAGLLAGRLMNIPGASEVYEEGFITYSDRAKAELLGVSRKTLEAYTAVSEQTAREMAYGAAKAAGADAALSVTGLAGPDGGTKERPVGLVYIGCCIGETVTVKEFHFSGDRAAVRADAVTEALRLLCTLLEG